MKLVIHLNTRVMEFRAVKSWSTGYKYSLVTDNYWIGL